METTFMITAAFPLPAVSTLARQTITLSSFPNMLTPPVWLKPGWGSHSVSLNWFHTFWNSSTCFSLLIFQLPGPAYWSFSSNPFKRHLTALSPSPSKMNNYIQGRKCQSAHYTVYFLSRVGIHLHLSFENSRDLPQGQSTSLRIAPPKTLKDPD